MPDLAEVAEALSHASRTADRDWAWLDHLLDLWLEARA